MGGVFSERVRWVEPSVGVPLYRHRFQWSAANFAPDFSITPVEGYISPGMEVSRAAEHQLHQVLWALDTW